MSDVRVCRFCGETLDPNDPEAFFDVENVITGQKFGDMHAECAVENLPHGYYRCTYLNGNIHHFWV